MKNICVITQIFSTKIYFFFYLNLDKAEKNCCFGKKIFILTLNGLKMGFIFALS
jgi:hypothetical protein